MNTWTESQDVVVNGYNKTVSVAVLLGTDGVPEQVSVITDDSMSNISTAAVSQVLRDLGFTAEIEGWEYGSIDEVVAFLSNVQTVRS
jgi:hypothetical protein